MKHFVKDNSLSIVMLTLLALLILLHWHDVPVTLGNTVGLPDPDPWLRLTLVRDWLTGGSWYSHEMLKSNAPWAGIESPWTRPLDLAIAFFTELQPHSVDLSIRLVRAAFILPLCWGLLMLVGLTRAMRALCPIPNAPLIAVLFFMTSLTMWGYYNLGNADHHGLLAALFICGVSGILAPAPSPARLIGAGAIFALQLWVSPEALVLIGGIYVWYGLLWLFDETADRKTLPILATSIALSSLVAVLIERPPALWLVPVYDTISIVYVFILSIAALLSWALYFYRPAAFVKRILFGGTTTAIAAALVAVTYPKIFHGPLVEADPFIFTSFLPRINEALPVYKNPSFWIIVNAVFQPLIALGLCGLALKRAPAIYRPRSIFQLLSLFLLTAGMYVSQQRFYYYFYPLSVLMLSPLIASAFAPEQAAVRGKWPARWFAAKSPLEQMHWRVPGIFTIIIVPMVLLLIFHKPDNQATQRIERCNLIARQWIQAGSLNDLGGGRSLILYANTDLGGEIMFWTPHRILASNYHREGPGIRYVWEAQDITDAEKLRRTLEQRQVDALLICPIPEPKAGSILQGLQAGKTPPAWLKRVTLPLPPTHAEPIKGAEPAIFLVSHGAH